MSARIYSAILSLYPADLRHDFGEEMTQVFLEDLEDSRRVHGFRGAARVWWRSVRELVRVALPLEASRREIAVPLIMYALLEVYLGTIMLLVERHNPHVLMPKSLGDMAAMAMPGLIPAFTAFVALRVGNRSVPVPLELSRIGTAHR